jgi:hypothetical protein
MSARPSVSRARPVKALGSSAPKCCSHARTLEDVDTIAFFTQRFDPGAALSFVLNTTNHFAGGVPDQFAMFLCDAAIATCYSDDAATGALLLLDLTGGSLTASSFVTIGASAQYLPAPVVSPVPEPSTTLLFGSAATLALIRRRRRGGAPPSRGPRPPR